MLLVLLLLLLLLFAQIWVNLPNICRLYSVWRRFSASRAILLMWFIIDWAPCNWVFREINDKSGGGNKRGCKKNDITAVGITLMCKIYATITQMSNEKTKRGLLRTLTRFDAQTEWLVKITAATATNKQAAPCAAFITIYRHHKGDNYEQICKQPDAMQRY